jgi:hypothetical protein
MRTAKSEDAMTLLFGICEEDGCFVDRAHFFLLNTG